MFVFCSDCPNTTVSPFSLGTGQGIYRLTIIAIFFKKQSAIFRFVIQSDHATFILKYPDRVYFYIYASICLIFFISVLAMIFLTSYLTSLQTYFSCPIKFANNIFCLSTPCKQFFSIFLIPPSRRIMVRP